MDNRIEAKLKCYRCGDEIRIPLYEPEWKVDLQPLGNPPSCFYTEYKDLSYLLQINELLGEQNVILKRLVLTLQQSLKYYLDSNKEKE